MLYLKEFSVSHLYTNVMLKFLHRQFCT